MTQQGIPILKRNMKKHEAVRIFEEEGMKDKVQLFKYRRSSMVSLYGIDGFEDYFYGYMVPDTSYLSVFELKKY